MKIELLFIDGRRIEREIPRQNTLQAIYKLIGCECGDVVNLRDGRVMIVDDTGILDGKPRNEQATELFHSIYPLTRAANRSICGDVAIAVDEDFA